jgi:hypothetical protein
MLPCGPASGGAGTKRAPLPSFGAWPLFANSGRPLPERSVARTVRKQQPGRVMAYVRSALLSRAEQVSSSDCRASPRIDVALELIRSHPVRPGALGNRSLFRESKGTDCGGAPAPRLARWRNQLKLTDLLSSLIAERSVQRVVLQEPQHEGNEFESMVQQLLPVFPQTESQVRTTADL